MFPLRALAASLALVAASIVLSAGSVGAECVWGNCENGRGTVRHPDGSLEAGVWRDGKLVVSKGRSQPLAPSRPAPATRAPKTRAPRPDRARKHSADCIRGDCINGVGVRVYPDGSNYEGAFVNGVRQGKGMQTWRDGRRYEGSWLADKRDGYGVQTTPDGRFVGTWRKGRPTRAGVRTFANGNRRSEPRGRRAEPGLVAGGSGCVAGNCWDGSGRFVYEDGREYVGTFRSGKPHGRGSLTHADGRVESGRWEDGKRWGRRVIAAPGKVASWRAHSRDRQGCVSGDCRNGEGTYRWRDGSAYTGAFRDSRPHGEGVWTHPDGARYAGGWRRGVREGRGTETTRNGGTRNGIWVEGRFQPAGRERRHASQRLRQRVRLRWPDLSHPAPRTGEGERDAAVIVGIERYAHVAQIPGASDNATAWYEYLVRTRGVPVERVALLLDEDATREDMEWAIDEAAQQVGDDGSLWFVFVGHGAPARDGEDGLLVGFDAQQKARSIEARSLSRTGLLHRLEASKADHIRVLLDACFSGRAGDGEQLVAGLQPLVVTRGEGLGDPRTSLFTAARNDEFAGPLPGAERPAFSYLALGGLRGWADRDRNGRVTAGELHRYVRTALQALVHDRRQRNTYSGEPDAALSLRAREKGPELSSLVAELAKRGRPPASR